jgi:hypothetical protein
MKKHETAFFTMTGRTISLFESNTAIWIGNKPIEKAIERLKLQYADSNKLLLLKEGINPTGYTSAKDSAYADMCDFGYTLSKRLCSLARETNDLKLLALVEYSNSSFTNGMEKEVLNRCKVMADQAAKYKATGADYKIDDESIAKLQTLIDTYNNMPEERDNVKKQKKVAGSDIEKEIQKMRLTFKLLDDLVEGLIEDSNFREKYTGARVIGDHKGRRNKEDNGNGNDKPKA